MALIDVKRRKRHGCWGDESVTADTTNHRYKHPRRGLEQPPVGGNIMTMVRCTYGVGFHQQKENNDLSTSLEAPAAAAGTDDKEEWGSERDGAREEWDVRVSE